MKRVYLATPYSHKDPYIMYLRYLNATHAAGLLMSKNYAVFSPITHCHVIKELCTLPHTWDWWETFDRSFIENFAEELWVYMQDGWEESVGVLAEIEIAKKCDKKVVYFYIINGKIHTKGEKDV